MTASVFKKWGCYAKSVDAVFIYFTAQNHFLILNLLRSTLLGKLLVASGVASPTIYSRYANFKLFASY